MEKTREDGEDTLPEGERDTVPMLRAAPDCVATEDGRVTIFVRGHGAPAEALRSISGRSPPGSRRR